MMPEFYAGEEKAIGTALDQVTKDERKVTGPLIFAVHHV
jgi:hypothetical protein